MKIGAWIHDHGEVALDALIQDASSRGMEAIRCYTIDYAERARGSLSACEMGLLAGMHVDAAALVRDWRSQVRLEELARYHELGLSLEAVCVGNELREGGDEPETKRFTARLSHSLANVLAEYREWMEREGVATPLTYAMEGIVFDESGDFREHVWPLIDACDVVSWNAYPFGDEGWFGWGAFEESEKFLRDTRYRRLRLSRYEHQLRKTLEVLSSAGKRLVLSETGFPSAVGYTADVAARQVTPEHDGARFGQVMGAFADLLREVNDDYEGIIQAVFLYEWWDNHHHSKIWNVEQSPIHTAFGLCTEDGVPKFDLGEVLGR